MNRSAGLISARPFISCPGKLKVKGTLEGNKDDKSSPQFYRNIIPEHYPDLINNLLISFWLSVDQIHFH